jgi:hypothetical protein
MKAHCFTPVPFSREIHVKTYLPRHGQCEPDGSARRQTGAAAKKMLWAGGRCGGSLFSGDNAVRFKDQPLAATNPRRNLPCAIAVEGLALL